MEMGARRADSTKVVADARHQLGELRVAGHLLLKLAGIRRASLQDASPGSATRFMPSSKSTRYQENRGSLPNPPLFDQEQRHVLSGMTWVFWALRLSSFGQTGTLDATKTAQRKWQISASLSDMQVNHQHSSQALTIALACVLLHPNMTLEKNPSLTANTLVAWRGTPHEIFSLRQERLPQPASTPL